MPTSKTYATLIRGLLPAIIVGVSLLPFGKVNAQKTKQFQSPPVPKASSSAETDGWRPASSEPLKSKLPRSSPFADPPVQKPATVPLSPFGSPPVNSSLQPLTAQIPTGKTFFQAQKEAWVQPTRVPAATTAEELLQQLTTRPTHYYFRPELSSGELEKSVQLLRERFPFRSIRDRLYFVDGETATKNDDKERHRTDASRYTSALRSLHSERVEKFITQEGFGVTRISPVGPQDLFLRDQHYALTRSSVDSSVFHEEEIELDETIKMRESRAKMDEGKLIPDYQFMNSLSENGLPKQQLLSVFNSRLSDSFATRTGYLKGIDQVAGFEAHRVRPGNFWSGNLRMSLQRPQLPGQQSVEETGQKTSWKVNRIELVSLLMHDEPCVYDTDELPNMEELSSDIALTRALSAFESEGIKALKSGEELLVRATRNRIVMVGAIRATENCLACHDGKSKDLLGAFSYEFLRSPAADTVANKNN